MSENAEKILEVLNNLRSVRKFNQKSISEQHIQIILHNAVKASNASNRQNYSIIIVRNPDLLNKYFYNAPLGLLFCVDYNRIIEVAKFLGHSYEVYEIFSFISGTMDTMLAAQNAAVSAKALGIDTLFTNSLHRVNLDEIYNTFNLPEEYCFPLLNLCLGYPSDEQNSKRGRYLGPGLIHEERYHHISPKELEYLVNEYDNPKKRIGSFYEHGMKHYLDWFYTKWSAGRYNQESIDDFYFILKRCKFLR